MTGMAQNSPEMSEKAVGVFIRVGPEIRRAIRIGAAEMDTTPAELVRQMILREVNRMGLLKEAPKSRAR